MTYGAAYITDSDIALERERRRRRSVPSAPAFRGAGQQAQTIAERAWIIGGPAETGKTFSALYRLDSEARKWPGSQWVLSRKVRATMDSTVLNTWRRIIALRGGVVAFGGERPTWYDYANGSRVWIVGMDNADKVLSGEFDGAYINQAEELDEADFETLSTRTTGRGAKTDQPMLFGDCNPGGEDHWIMRRAQSGALRLLESRHEDNPSLYDSAGQLTAQGVRTMAVLGALTGVRYQRLRLGRWVGVEGAFFAQLDEGQHLRRYDRAPAGWQVWAALDYGFAHPLSFGVFAYGPEGQVILLGRHSAMRWYVPQHASAMNELLESLGVAKKGLKIVAGHDCWEKGDKPETVAEKFAGAGFVLEHATIGRVSGARALGERLGNPDAKPAPVPPSLFLNERYGGRAVFDCLARMKPDPRNEEDVLKVNADAEGRGGDDDYDMIRYGVMAAPSRPKVAQGQQIGGLWAR